MKTSALTLREATWKDTNAAARSRTPAVITNRPPRIHGSAELASRYDMLFDEEMAGRPCFSARNRAWKFMEIMKRSGKRYRSSDGLAVKVVSFER